MITARQIFKELGGANKKKAMDFLRNNATSRRVFRTDFTKDFWDDLKERRDGKLDQHIVLNTFGETGCLSENTKLLGGKRLCDYGAERINTFSYDFEKRKVVKSKSQLFFSGKKELVEIELVDGRKVLATRDHRFFVVRSGMILEKSVDELRKNDNLMVAGDNFNNIIKTIRIKSIKKIGVEDTYDLSTPIYHNYVLDNGIVSHNSFKSGVEIEVGRFMYKDFGARDITFTDNEFLQRVKETKKGEFVLRDEITKEYGIGSGRQNAFIVMQTETLRAHRTSLAFISPTLKPIDTAHYILHAIGHNNFEIDDEGNALEPVYVLTGVMNPMTHNYLGGLIVEIDWLNKVWKQYWKKKVEFLKKVRERHFQKADFFEMAGKVLEDPKSNYAKTKYEWIVIIQQVYPDLTTEEVKMLYATIKLQQRMG